MPLEKLLAASVAATDGASPRPSAPPAEPALLELADLLRMEEAHNYSRWLLARLGPYLGDHVLEIAAGVGTHTEALLHAGKRVTACEANPNCLTMLRTRVGSSPRFELCESAFGSDQAEHQLGSAIFDSVLCVNELAFVADPERLLRSAYQRLRVGGRLLLLVPAGPRLMGSLDRALGHRRRYDRRGLEAALRVQPWSIEILRYTNALGWAGWALNAKLLRRRKQSLSQILLFDRLAVPLLRALERHVEMPAGQSLLAVARK